MSWLYFFLLMFPSSQLIQCNLLTNIVLRKQRIKETTTGVFGILVLLSKFKFCKHRDLWTNTSKHRYVLASALGKTGIPLNRFDLCDSK